MKLPPLIGRSLERGLAPLARDRATNLIPRTRMSGPVPWVLAIMIALTVLAAAGGLALNNLADSARTDLSGGVTVQIVEADQEILAEQTRAAEAILRDNAAVQSFRTVPQDELDALLEPWLGAGDAVDSVPMPALIDVQLREAAGAQEIEQLQAALTAISGEASGASSIRVDAQSGWLRPVYSALSALQYLAGVLVVLLALASAAAVWLAARSSFFSHRETIEIVHLLGGQDDQIARLFQSSVAIDAIVGGIIGLLAGMLGVLIIGSRFAGLDSGMVTGGGLGGLDWVMIALIPFGAIIIAVLTARVTVIAALRRMT
ncbi:MAG: cell division protein [Erythrobacter sp.]